LLDIPELTSNMYLAEITGIAAADLIHEFLSMLMADTGPIPTKGAARGSKDEL
jgi:hypothetical protein